MIEFNGKIDIKSLNLQELTDLVKEMGEPAFRAKQLYQWLHVKRVRDYDEMTNIPKSLKDKCREKCVLVTLKTVQVQNIPHCCLP